MSKPNQRQGSTIMTGRGLVTLLAAVPLVLVGFVIGYGVGADHERSTETIPAWDDAQAAVTDHAPTAATFTATAIDGSAPPAPAVLPVGDTDDLGITVTHLQFRIDESTVRPDHAAELRLPVLVPPDSDAMLLEVASVHPVACLCGLTADTAPPYGRVWDTAEVDSTTGEVVFDITGAIDAPGRYGFAITTPDLGSYLELQGAQYDGRGPVLRTQSAPDPAPSPPPAPTQTPTAFPTAQPTDQPSPEPTDAPTAEPIGGQPTPAVPESGQAAGNLESCGTGDKLIPRCGALVGVAPGAHTSRSKEQALLDFEANVDRTQHIYHAYERADGKVFPTRDQIALATDPENPRTLFINWKPRMASWADIAAGDERVDAYLDRLAEHINTNFDRPFFFTVHHEPENDVVQRAGSGMEAADYARMYRYVIEYLRDRGVDNLVTVMNYMGYLKWVEKPWHDQLYPGEDVVDWIGLSGYGQSLHDDGHSDFSEIIDQTKDSGSWPGFYHWVGRQHPDKPVMLAEWGVFHHEDYPDHQAAVFKAAYHQLAHYPRLKAIVYFESPNAEGRNSEVHRDEDTLEEFRNLMGSPHFDVDLVVDR